MTVQQTIASGTSQFVELDRDELLAALNDATPDEVHEATHEAMLSGAEAAPSGLVIVVRSQAKAVLSF